MKKIFVIVFLVLCVVIYKWDSEDTEPVKSNNEAIGETGSISGSNPDFPSNAVDQLLFWQHRYAARHNIPLADISGKDGLAKWLAPQATDPEPAVYLRGKGGLFSEIQYIVTDQQDDGANYIYQGELRGDYPDGYGVLSRCKYVYEGQYEIVYIGEFKDGYFDGYGLLFKETNRNDSALLYFGENMDLAYSFLNYVQVEGRFKEGKVQGTANRFTAMPAIDLQLYQASGNQNEFTPDEFNYTIMVGKFQDGEPKGQGKVYIGGDLYYEGKLEDYGE